MVLMSRFLRPRGLTLCLALLPFIWEAGCSRPAGFNTGNGSASAGQQHPAPFHDAANGAPGDLTAPHSPTVPDQASKPETDLPFRELPSLPAGSLLTVRLKNAVTAENPDSSGAFEAIVDEPVTIEGKAVVPRGATVTGRAAFVRTSEPGTWLQATGKRSNYMRVILDSIDLDGRGLRIQTSSLLVRASRLSGEASPQLLTLEKGRRLTFWLTEPVYLALQSPLPSH
jgi:hypothetical protein